jgi:drug/metabolite transporter (DMT)-like permease
MRARPYLLLALLALVWGVHWPIAKIGLRYMPPFTYGALRVGVGLLAMLILSIRGGIRLPPRQDIPVVLSVGLGQMAGGIALMNLALQVVSPGRSSILVYTMPLWVALMQISALRSSGASRQLGGLALGLAGIVLLINPMAIDWGSSGQLLGSGALLASAVMWAATTIHIRTHRWRATPTDLEIWQLLVAFVPLGLAALVLDPGQPIDLEPTALFAIFFSGVLATALAFWLSQSISRSLSPLATTMGFLAVPVVGVASSWLLVGEPLTLLDLAGATLTFGGIMVVSTRAAGAGSQHSEVAPAGAADAA